MECNHFSHDIGLYTHNNSWGIRSEFNDGGIYITQISGNAIFATTNMFGISVQNCGYGIDLSSNTGNGIISTNNDQRAGWFKGKSSSDFPVLEIDHENDSIADVHFGGIARITSESGKGISLPAENMPLITRAWGLFTSGKYEGIGRWDSLWSLLH